MFSLVKDATRPFLSALLAACLISSPLAAAGITAGKEKLVNTKTRGFQYYGQKMVTLNNDGWVVVWPSEKTLNNNTNLFLQAYKANGRRKGKQFKVHTYSKKNQNAADIAALNNGGWVVTWVSEGQDGDGGGIYQQVFKANGTKKGAEELVNSTTTGDQSSPTVTVRTNGSWVVTWQSEGQDGDSGGIYQQVFKANGTKKGGEKQVNSTTAGVQSGPISAALKDGGWVVIWNSEGQDGSLAGIFLQAYNPNGSKRGLERQVNTSTASPQERYQILALDSGGWVVVWTDRGAADGGGPNLGDDWGVFQQAYNANGTKLRTETQINATAEGQQGVYKSIAALKDGGWVVVFSDSQKDGDMGGIFMQVYNTDATARGGEIQVNTYTTSYQHNPAAAALNDGGWVVTWQSNEQDGNAGGVYQQAYKADGTKNGDEMRVNDFTNSDQSFSQVTPTRNGGWAVTWTSWGPKGDQMDIYQRIYRSN